MLTQEQLKGTMSDEEKITQMKEIIVHSHAAMKYLFDNLADISENAEKKCVRKVYTTLAYDLGIACPDLVIHRVVRGNKKGRIIKNIPENNEYCEIGYDDKKHPLYFKPYYGFDDPALYLFFEFDGCVWAAETLRYPEIHSFDVTRCKFDEKERILEYAHISGGPMNGGGIFVSRDKNRVFRHVLKNGYVYSDEPESPIICRSDQYNSWYYPESGTTAPIIDPEHNPYDHLYNQSCCEISPDHKNIKLDLLGN